VLYTDHLVAIEIAGILLFVALVGGALIALPRATMARESRASVDLR
jgi:NADH:ubiquinone oxidoreductase subunit 6 (subunit J)